MCCHEWEPLPKLNGRYECTMCGVKGYNLVICKNVKFRPKIVPYICSVSKCGAEARLLIKHSGGFKGFCWEHKTKTTHKKWIDVKCPVCNAPGGGLCRKMSRRPNEAKYCRMKNPHKERLLVAKGEFKNLELFSVT